MNKFQAFLFAAGTLAAPAALAHADHVDIEKRLTAEQMRATGLDALTSGQLRLLNTLLRDPSPPVAATSAEPVELETRVEPAVAARAVPREAALDTDSGPIRSRVVGEVAGWRPGTVFELANGQHWQVLKGSATLDAPLRDPSIEVVPGFSGRWFLQVLESMPKARVILID